jgi:adenosylcobinamide-GDP ribazoletransferase
MKGFILALQFLTRLPTPRMTATGAEFAASMRWFPAAGLVIGVIVAGGALAGARLDPWTGALAGLVLWVLVTGALHLDGLGDLADAQGAVHGDKEKLLAVLADPHIGSFGVVAIGLQLIAKLVLLHAVIGRGAEAGLVFIPFAARIAPLWWAKRLPPLHAGLGSKFSAVIRWRDLALWGAGLVAAAVLFPALLVLLAFIPLFGWRLMRTLGGVSGDAHGAGIELAETLILAGLAVTGASPWLH